MNNIVNLNPEWINKYQESLNNHLKYFRIAARELKVPEKQILIHDNSKLSKEEYNAYVRYFGGGLRDKSTVNDFNIAWLHHIHNNPHHWQHWIIPEGKALEIPIEYIREMVADWLGSSMAYTNSFDMTEWLEKNLSSIKLHSNSKSYLYSILSIEYDICSYDLSDLIKWSNKEYEKM